MDIREVEEFVKYRIANTAVREYPYPHFHVEGVFPEEYYRQILANWPAEARFQSIAETGRTAAGTYRERHVMNLPLAPDSHADWSQKPFWDEFAQWFLGPGFLHFLVTHYKPWIVKGRQLSPQINVRAEGLLVQDHSNYAISPHTDAAHRLVSTLFYCPPDAGQSHLGTSIYVTKDGSVAREIQRNHLPRENFLKVSTAPFVPNSMFGFVVCRNSWHGVDRILDDNVRRNVILHYARLNS